MNNSTNPTMNGKSLRMHIAEGTSEISRGDALAMKVACEKWLLKNDPSYTPSSGFCFGSFSNRRRNLPPVAGPIPVVTQAP